MRCVGRQAWRQAGTAKRAWMRGMQCVGHVSLLHGLSRLAAPSESSYRHLCLCVLLTGCMAPFSSSFSRPPARRRTRTRCHSGRSPRREHRSVSTTMALPRPLQAYATGRFRLTCRLVGWGPTRTPCHVTTGGSNSHTLRALVWWSINRCCTNLCGSQSTYTTLWYCSFFL